MSTLKSFENSKKNLLDIYNEILNSQYVPIEVENITIDKNNLTTWIDNLKNEKFIVSVCGQINVGKSTFLNDYIFEDEILPSASTPETAKLTEITYGQPGYTVEFYSNQEWEEIKKQTVKDSSGTEKNYYEEFIKPAIKRYIDKSGEIIYPEQIISQKTFSGTNLKDLNLYISADGKYTPFVRLVKITYPSDILKGITIVDTPGTNDPNKFRARVTEEWIGKSDAVIFLMYAGQALTAQDSDFIEQFLLPVPSEKILIGLSKVDSVEDFSRPKDYVENSLKDSSFGRTVANKTVYPVSPMFSLYPKLWEKHKNNEIKLTNKQIEDIQFQLGERGEDSKIQKIIENKGFMPEFKVEVENHLIKNKGIDILKSHKKKIESIFEYNIRKLLFEKEKFQEKSDLYNKSEEEIKKDGLKLKQSVKEFEEIQNEINNERQVIKENLSKDIDNLSFLGVKQLTTKIERYINSKDFDYLVHNFAFDFKNTIEDFLRFNFSVDLKKIMNKYQAEFEDLLKRFEVKIENLNIFSSAFIRSIFSVFSLSEMVEEIENKIRQKFYGSLETFRQKKFFFFTNEKDSKEKLLGYTKDFLSDRDFKSPINSIKNVQLERIEKVFEKLSKELVSMIDEKRVAIKKVNEKNVDIIEERNKCKAGIKQISDQIDKINEKVDSIKQKISVSV